ncbi:MAG: acyl carrier protein [Spirochaetes bacterium]|jgi:acyl carrier protein|nr:acyl carrier protein [Spirochaetota bacterium]NLJ04417.1 acyl carrier protein [Exilispira sp.]MBP8991824.1 acyl carrier protein [Spirochaetota bacterium]HNV44574.1 acyl carrier protein [Exilispira sp.]HOV46749.1 acyl carrier protein [Exilispira sp.]
MTVSFEELRNLLVEKLGVEKDSITETAHFVNDLGIDSLEQVDLMMELEKRYQITIPDEDLEKLTDVKGLLTYLNEKLANK